MINYGLEIAGILRERFYFVFIEDYSLDSLDGCLAVFDGSNQEATHCQCANAYKKGNDNDVGKVLRYRMTLLV